MIEKDFSTAVKNMRRRTIKLDREGDHWTAEDDEQIDRMFHAGEGITNMAIQLQRTEPAILQRIEKLDLYQRRENPRRRVFNKEPSECLFQRRCCDSASCPLYKDCKGRQEV